MWKRVFMVTLMAVAVLLLWSGVAAAAYVTELGDDTAGIGAVLPPESGEDWTGGDGGSTAPGDDVVVEPVDGAVEPGDDIVVEPGDDVIVEPGDDPTVEPDDGRTDDGVVGGDDPLAGEDGATDPTDDYAELDEWLEESIYASEAGDLAETTADEPRNFGERISSLRHADDNTPAAAVKGMEVRGYQQRSNGGK